MGSAFTWSPGPATADGDWSFTGTGPSVRQIDKSRNLFLVFEYNELVATWSFLTNHARVLLAIAGDPDARLRDLAGVLGITERTVFGIVNDLTAAGYVVKERNGRRNRYHIQEELPLPIGVGRERTIGEVLDLLVAAERRPRPEAHRRRRDDRPPPVPG